jgi:hypothetical protein
MPNEGTKKGCSGRMGKGLYTHESWRGIYILGQHSYTIPQSCLELSDFCISCEVGLMRDKSDVWPQRIQKGWVIAEEPRFQNNQQLKISKQGLLMKKDPIKDQKQA